MRVATILTQGLLFAYNDAYKNVTRMTPKKTCFFVPFFLIIISTKVYGAVHVKGDINVKNEYSFLGGT